MLLPPVGHCWRIAGIVTVLTAAFAAAGVAYVRVEEGAGFYRAKDYRKVDVLAATAPVPDTSWGLVSKKVDAEEVFAPLRKAGVWALAMGAFGLLAAAGWGAAGWRSRQAGLLRAALRARAVREDLERRLGAIADQANDIIVLLDERFRITEVNNRASEMWGYSREDLLGCRIMDLRAPRARVTDAAYKEVLQRGDRPYETVHCRRDGTEFSVEVTARPMMFEGRRVYQEIIRDTSERKRAEAALIESEARLAATLRSIGDGVVATDDQGRVTGMNPIAETLTGWRLSEAEGHPLDEVFRIISEKTREPALSPVTMALRDGTSVGLVNHTLLVSRDGSERPILDSAAPIRNNEGSIIGGVLVFRDGTAARAVEVALGYQTNLLASLTEAVIAADPELNITAWNPAAERITGLEAPSALGRPMREVLSIHASCRQRSDTPAELPSALLSTERTETPLPVVRGDGVVVHIQGHGTELRDDAGHTTGYVIVLRDVSEQLEMKGQLRLAERLSSLGTLAAGVAHEINNPLTAVMGNLDCALEDLAHESSPIVETVIQELKEAKAAGDRVRSIVRDLKVLSRGDDETVQPVNLVSVLKSSIAVTRNAIRHRAELCVEFADVPDVRGNESRLAQVFINLLMNAVQAIPDGSADSNRIRVATQLRSPGRVAVEIEDTGAGISPDIRQRIFDPFFTTKAVGDGTGLGLAICNRIVSRLGGEIRVESEVGKGSRFTVVLSACEPDQAAPVHELERTPVSTRRPIARLLVVDDDSAVTRVIQRIFSGIHDVSAAHTGREALDLIAQRSFDVVFCDLMMPEMTGMDFYEHICQMAPALVERTVFITGGAFTQRAQAFLDRVENARIEKPFDPQVLRTLVEGMLTRARRLSRAVSGTYASERGSPDVPGRPRAGFEPARNRVRREN